LPALQLSPPPHTVPQAPQFVRSFCSLTQDWAHWESPAAQVPAHAPAEQTCPPAHLVPQVPQLPLSDFVSMQRSPHLVVPPPQLSAHAPWEQTCPVAHLVPQVPQFSGSRPTTVHTPLHSCAPAPHAFASVLASVTGAVVPGSELHAPTAVAAQIIVPAATAPFRPL